MKGPPINWLNNSYYAAEAIQNIARYEGRVSNGKGKK